MGLPHTKKLLLSVQFAPLSNLPVEAKPPSSTTWQHGKSPADPGWQGNNSLFPMVGA